MMDQDTMTSTSRFRLVHRFTLLLPSEQKTENGKHNGAELGLGILAAAVSSDSTKFEQAQKYVHNEYI
jgi:hypothetical protein